MCRLEVHSFDTDHGASAHKSHVLLLTAAEVRQGNGSIPGCHCRRGDSLPPQVNKPFNRSKWLLCVHMVWVVFVSLSWCSYPYSEEYTKPTQYMNTRCPSWCDRILMSHSARDIIYRVRSAPSSTIVLFRITKPRGQHWELDRLLLLFIYREKTESLTLYITHWARMSAWETTR